MTDRPDSGSRSTIEEEVHQLRERVAEFERAEAERGRELAALAETGERLRDLIGNVPGAVYRSDAQPPWRDVFVSEQVRELCGYSAEELTRSGGTAFGELILPEDRPAVSESIASAVHHEGRFELRYRIRHADGSVRWMHDQGRVIPAPDGSPRWLEGVVIDITQPMRVEVALRESEERFRTLVANTPGTVYRSEVRHPFKDSFLSEGTLALTGYTAAQFMQSGGPAFGDLTLPEDQAMVLAAVEAAIAGSGTFGVRYRLRHREGSIRWVHDQGRVHFGDDGTPLWLDGLVVDVTDRAQAEEALRTSEARYRTIVGSVPGAVFLCEPQHPWKSLFMSGGVEGLTGYPASSFSGAGGALFTSITLTDDIPRLTEATEAAIARGELWRLRYRIRHADGSTRWVYEEGQASYGPEGTPIFLGGVILDITDRMVAEEWLRESEERFRTLVANIPGTVYRSEVEYPYRDIFLSDGMLALSGYPAEDFLRPGGITIGDLMLEADRPLVAEAVDAAVRARLPFEIRYRFRHANGEIRWVKEQGQAAYGPDGTAQWLDGVMLDITVEREADAALRRSEARLLEAQHIANMGSWELDLRTEALYWSDEIFRIFELDVRQFGATYQAFLAAIHPDDREEVNRAFTASVQQRLPYDIVHRLLMRDGRIKYVHERGETQYAEDGTPIRSAGTVQEITDRRLAEQSRQALEVQLRQAQKMEAIGTLAGGIAHDFNNILAAVIGNAELLAQDLAGNDAGREGIEAILLASRRARDLVQQILTFSRLREQERRLIPLEPVILEALKLLRATLPATVEIRTAMTDEDHLVLADATQIHQTVINLCTNGAHAMRVHGGILDLSYQPVRIGEAEPQYSTLLPGLYMRLSVRDTGHGMDRPTVERVFDPFFTTKGPGEGTGLGLAVVHGIMQSHDGAVTVGSEPGVGTIFSLYFPAVEGRVDPASPNESPIPQGVGQHVLVVDDEPALVRIATRIFERLGYRVTAMAQPTDALAAFQARPDEFDFVFCDLTMPRMTGLELARELTALRPELPVILTSGYSGAIEPGEMRKLGIREVVAKPFLVRTLAEAAERALRRP